MVYIVRLVSPQCTHYVASGRCTLFLLIGFRDAHAQRTHWDLGSAPVSPGYGV